MPIVYIELQIFSICMLSFSGSIYCWFVYFQGKSLISKNNEIITRILMKAKDESNIRAVI
jgi:hypothetical protein